MGNAWTRTEFGQLEEGVQPDDMAEVPGQTEFPPKADADPAVVDEMDVLPGSDPVFDQARLEEMGALAPSSSISCHSNDRAGRKLDLHGLEGGWFGWGFFLAWIPFLLGVLGILLFWNTRWLHVRVQQKPG